MALALSDAAGAAVKHAYEWGLIAAIIGIGPGLAIGILRHIPKLEFVLANDLPTEERFGLVKWAFGSLAVVLVAYMVGWLRARKADASTNLSEYARRQNGRWLVLAGLPIGAQLASSQLEKDEPVLTLVLCAILAIGVAGWRYFASGPSASPTESTASDRPSFWRGERLPTLIAAGLGIGYAVAASFLSILDHHNLGTHVFDLGIYANVVWRTSQGEFLACSFCRGDAHVAAHFDPILTALVPLHLLWPKTELLLLFQSCWLASGAIPLFLWTRYRMKSAWYGAWAVFVYVMTPALQGANLFDFHSLTLIIPTSMWLMYFLERERKGPFFFFLAIALLTREDMSLLSSFIGIYAILSGRTRMGVATILVSMAYLAFAKGVMMPSSGLLMPDAKDSFSYFYYYEDMIKHKEEGTSGLLVTLLTNPAFALKVLFFPEKVTFFLQILIPMLFLPLLAGRRLVIALYGLVFIGLASRRHVYSLHFQYSSVFFPALLFALPEGLSRLTDSAAITALRIDPLRLRRALAWGVAVASLLVTLKFGAYTPNSSFRAGWNRIEFRPSKSTLERAQCLEQLSQEIPPDAPLACSTTLCPHLANRQKITNWPTMGEAQYVLTRGRPKKPREIKRLEEMLKDDTFVLTHTCSDLKLYKRNTQEDSTAKAEREKSERENGVGEDPRREAAEEAAEE
jgi:uncharacterized membrane protein